MASVIRITVLINSANNEASIAEVVENARLLSGDVLVVDSESSDRTREIASSCGARVIVFPCARYVEPARMFGVSHAQGDWIFVLDTDERLTPKLISEIKTQLESTTHTHFRVPRKNIFAKTKWLRYGGWWPDFQTRLFRKASLRDWPARIHATPVIDGTGANLRSPILHFFHSTVHDMVAKTTVFEDIESELLYQAKRRATTKTFFRKYAGELYRRLVRQMGFLDGEYGLLEAIYQAYSKTITYLMLYEKNLLRARKKDT
jgi:glycosyltransferase involved in cell wall biosynthesis